jgi:hypothetical protein
MGRSRRRRSQRGSLVVGGRWSCWQEYQEAQDSIERFGRLMFERDCWFFGQVGRRSEAGTLAEEGLRR